jgi:Tn3 transposase DDE domain
VQLKWDHRQLWFSKYDSFRRWKAQYASFCCAARTWPDFARCYGRQGELATNSREQQEVVTLSLQLLQNCLMLINTLLVERTIEREGLWERLTTEDFRALTPLFHGHINPYGQFALDLARPSFLEAA